MPGHGLPSVPAKPAARIAASSLSSSRTVAPCLAAFSSSAIRLAMSCLGRNAAQTLPVAVPVRPSTVPGLLAISAPHGDSDAEIERQGQFGDGFAGDLVGLEAAQAREAEMEREPAQAVEAALRILLDQPDLAEADDIRMRLARWHAGRVGDVAQHHRPGRIRQHRQDAAGDLDRLNAAPAGHVGGGVGGDGSFRCRHGPLETTHV
jgi:hypothetical protein